MTKQLEKLKPKLTLKPRSLNGSPDCRNCGTRLQGPYCHFCGQPDRNLRRFFPALAREILGESLDFDNRFFRTLKPLLLHPGKLSHDYMLGRRFRYTSPVRLYLFSSIVFFVLASFATNFSLRHELSSETEKPPVSLSPDHDPTVAKVADKPSGKERNGAGEQPDDDFLNISIDSNDAVDIPFFPRVLNDWINRELARAEEKKQAIESDPTLIANKIFDLLPMTIFVLLPVFALILKLFYLFNRRYYTEHLVFALYNHSFVFVTAIGLLLVSGLNDALQSAGWIQAGSLVDKSLGMVFWLLVIWIPVYFWLAMKRYYQQGWLLTSGKFLVIGLCYSLILISVTSLVVVVGFLLL